MCSIHNVVQLLEVDLSSRLHTVWCLYKCIDLIKLGLPKILFLQDGWTALDESSLKLTAQAYILWLLVGFV